MSSNIALLTINLSWRSRCTLNSHTWRHSSFSPPSHLPKICPISPPALYVIQHSLNHSLPLSPPHSLTDSARHFPQDILYKKKTKLIPSVPLPQQSPALSAIGSTGCQASDFACLCKDNSFINAALAGAEKQCPQADLQKVLAFAQQICGSVGVSLSVSASAEGSSTPSPVTSTSTSVPSPVTTGTHVLQSASQSGSAAAAATTATSQASETAASTISGTASSGASGWDSRFGLRGMMWSGAFVGWWLFGFGP